MQPEQPFIPHEQTLDTQHDTDPERLAREERVRMICQSGNHHSILESFKDPENHILLEEHTRSLQSDHRVREQLSGILASLSPAHWEMLTLLHLFDTETFNHCIRTYQIVQRKLQSTHPIGEFLRTELSKEGVPQETLAISALLHDIGKIGIPLKELILNNTLTDQEWHHLCVEHFCKQDRCDTEQAEATLALKLTAGAPHNLREKDLVPFSYCLTSEQRDLLVRSGINPDQTLGEIINTHQDFSGEIARAYGLDDTFVALVSNHHERSLDEEESHPVSQSALRIATILRFADVFDAIHSTRTYKKGNPFLTTIAILIRKSHDGFIDPRLAHLWIDEDMQIFEASQKDYFRILPEAIDREHEGETGYSVETREAIIAEERNSLIRIHEFLEKTL